MTGKIFLLTAVMAGFCFAQGPVKVAVKFNVQDQDRIGAKLIYKVKENIRSSNGMALTALEGSSDVQIEIITMMITSESGEPAPYTVYSILYTFTARPSSYKAVMYHSIGLCEQEKIDDVAEGIVVKTDQLIQTFKVLSKK
jgi:hypothetical protein